MASPVTVEDHSNTKTDEGTTAFHKKRSRRVSFAENTSIHIFDRDEPFESPPDPNPPSSPNEDDSGSRKFFPNEEEDNEDELGPRSPFLRVVVSPSSGGSTIGSAISNDEDNFFGPVATSFIRRDLSDSAASDDIHDQTMDSTSFSMHYRSIARSDSEGELKTSTGVHLSFEEKTPTPSSNPYNTKSSMKLTQVNKPNSQPDVSTSKLNSGSQSNDMNLVGEYHVKYDYGKLSPALDAFLAEGGNDLHVVSDVSVLKSPVKAGKQLLAKKENESDLMDFSYGQDNKMEGNTSHEELNEVVSVKHNEIDMTNDGSKLFGVLSDIQVSKFMSPNQSMRGSVTGINSSLEFLPTSKGTPLSSRSMVYQLDDAIEKEDRSPLVGSVTDLTDRPSHMLLNGARLSKSPGPVTPSNYQASFISRTSVSSLKKSISKLRILEASPFSAVLSAKLEESNSRSLFGISKMSPLVSLLEKNKFPDVDDNKIETPKNPVPIARKDNFVDIASQFGLPSEEHMQPNPNLLKSADIRHGCKDNEKKFGSPQTVNCSSKKLKKATSGKFIVSPYRYEEQLISHNELFSEPNHVGGLEESISNTRISTPLNVADSNIEELVHSRKEFLYDIISNSETRGNLKTLSNDIKHEKFQSIFEGRNIPSGQKNLADQSGRSPSNKEVYGVLHNDIIDSLHEENVQSSARKRKTEDVATAKIAKIKMTSDSGLELPCGSGLSRISPNPKHLVEIRTRFFKETKLLTHSVDKMNLHAIDRLVDILEQLQRSKAYQLLSNEIQSQSNVEPSSIIHNKRVAETKLLLCKFVHEQAKLQLMHVKRERLFKNSESLVSGIQESEMLKLKYSSQNLLDAQVIHRQFSSHSIKDIQECQVDDGKVTSMRQAIKDIDERISNLTKSFHISCKMKGEPKPTDTIALVNDQLMKRAQCQIIRKNMQLWVLNDLKSSKDHHDIVLNYLDLMLQRFTVTAGVVPSISISNVLNEMNIQKKFKDMNALTAFGFVFDAGLIQKHIGATSLAQETQMTSSCLGNLIDVMEEIKLAKIRLKNLVYARFHKSSDERLDLELFFIDSNTRKKATVTLNTSCLKSGIYPSEIAVYQIDISVGESQSSSSQTLSAEIEAAVQDLRVGFFRILRLCICISQLLSLRGKN